MQRRGPGYRCQRSPALAATCPRASCTHADTQRKPVGRRIPRQRVLQSQQGAKPSVLHAARLCMVVQALDVGEELPPPTQQRAACASALRASRGASKERERVRANGNKGKARGRGGKASASGRGCGERTWLNCSYVSRSRACLKKSLPSSCLPCSELGLSGASEPTAPAGPDRPWLIHAALANVWLCQPCAPPLSGSGLRPLGGYAAGGETADPGYLSKPQAAGGCGKRGPGGRRGSPP